MDLATRARGRAVLARRRAESANGVARSVHLRATDEQESSARFHEEAARRQQKYLASEIPPPVSPRIR